MPGVGLVREVSCPSAARNPGSPHARFREPGPSSLIERTYLAVDAAGMAKPPSEPPPQPTTWNIYKVAAKMIWLGTVEAPDRKAAIEKALQEFKMEAWRLLAVRRR
jgi:hypothetical protein